MALSPYDPCTPELVMRTMRLEENPKASSRSGQTALWGTPSPDGGTPGGYLAAWFRCSVQATTSMPYTRTAPQHGISGDPSQPSTIWPRPGTLWEVCSIAGCGTGEHALLAASLGHDVMGVDLSAKAIELAMTKAAERGVEARFLVADALRLVDLGEQFDSVLDCGLFHVLGDNERERYVDSLTAVVAPGGRLHMLCFSDRQPGDWGPRRVTQEELRTSFSFAWEIESIEPTIIDLTWDPAGAFAWLMAAAHR